MSTDPIEYETPCQRSDTPDDWFIDRTGKQYKDDEVIEDPDAKKVALQRRRHAKEACFDCYLRTQCLDVALREQHAHGTWGGYYEEELRRVRREIGRRGKTRKE